MKETISQQLAKVRKMNPLVHNITNVVVTHFTANGLLALGASPVMAYSKHEVADMARIAGAVVLNIGTLDEGVVESMIIAGRSANEQGVPVVLDPVGAGATVYRTKTAQRILNEIDVSLIRGNAAEIANVIGEVWEIKGVDAGAANHDPVELARHAATKLNTCVVITGKEDVVTDGETTYIVHNGHPILTKVTGTGCLLTSVIGAFLAVEKDIIVAATSAVAYYGITAEVAYKVSGEKGPGSFQIELLNQLSHVSSSEINQLALVEKR